MSTTHTPGPWRILPDNYSGETHWMVVDSNGAPLFDSVNRSPAADDATEQSDLILAAAAPDLLAELQNIANANPSTWDAETRDQFQLWAQNRARSAIAKATGIPA